MDEDGSTSEGMSSSLAVDPPVPFMCMPVCDMFSLSHSTALPVALSCPVIKLAQKSTFLFSSSETKSRKNVPPAGRLQRALRRRTLNPHQPGPVCWHLTQPVYSEYYVVAGPTGSRP